MFGLLPVNVLPLCRYCTMDRFDFVHLMSIESVPQRQRARRSGVGGQVLWVLVVLAHDFVQLLLQGSNNLRIAIFFLLMASRK